MPKNIFSELKGLFSLKDEIKKIIATQKRIEKQIEKLDGQVCKLYSSAYRKQFKKAISRGKKRIKQPYLDNVIINVLKKSKKPLSVNEIEEIIKRENLYVSSSKKFKNNIRVALYKNSKKSFKKVARGKFALIANARKK